MSETNRRLADLLVDVHEKMDLEIKNWLDFSTNEHQAKLAKAIIAMANHGGGYILIGFDERPGKTAVPSPGRPASLVGYDGDRVNGISEKYIEPAVHCEVHHIPAPDGIVYPLVIVPGGHRSPIMAKRDGPAGGELKQRAIYIRRTGPKSEEPKNAQEMSDLFDRCFSNRRDDIGNLIRTILSGSIPSAGDGAVNRLDEWIESGLERFGSLTKSLAANDPRRFPRGYVMFAYQIRGAIKSISTSHLLQFLQTSTPRHTGWPPWWAPTRPEIQPYPIDGTIECWLGVEDGVLHRGAPRDAAHADFWRVSPEGFAFLLRGYQEDGPEVEQQGYGPSTVIDVTLPVWRAGEVLLHASNLSSYISDGPTDIALRIKYTGLEGRFLASVSHTRLMMDRDICRQDSVALETVVEISAIRDQLPDVLFTLLRPLYEMFNFFRLPKLLVQEETTKMKSGSYG
jgi:hypothetical protein